MVDFVPAVLILLSPDAKGSTATTPRDPQGSGNQNKIPVQFNPTSLRLQRSSSQTRSGMLIKNQQVQYPSTQAATLSFDLEFDSAEDFTTGTGQTAALPVDVRTRTQRIHLLVEPGTQDPAAAPHRVRFEWGTFAFQGVVSQLTEEFDLFAANGTPLRSKISLTIEEQDPALAANARGAGARTEAGTTQPGGAPDRSAPPGSTLRAPRGAAPGHAGTDQPRLEVRATQGESVQQVAARLGADPSSWRALMTNLPSPVALAAGTSVLVGPELDTPAVIGRASGFAAGAADSPVQVLAGTLGLSAARPRAASADQVSGAATTAEAAGFALAAAGGLTGATRVVLASDTAAAAAAERVAFTVPRRAPGAPRGGPPTSAGQPAEVDPRALSYGRALPLRSRVHSPTANEARSGGSLSLAARAQPVELVVSGTPSERPWERLPPAANGRREADLAQRGRDARASTMRWKPGGEC